MVSQVECENYQTNPAPVERGSRVLQNEPGTGVCGLEHCKTNPAPYRPSPQALPNEPNSWASGIISATCKLPNSMITGSSKGPRTRGADLYERLGEINFNQRNRGWEHGPHGANAAYFGARPGMRVQGDRWGLGLSAELTRPSSTTGRSDRKSARLGSRLRYR